MRFILRLLLLCCLGFAAAPLQFSSAAELYAVAELPTPVFNVADFSRLFGGSDGATLQTDSCGQFRQLEFVALPGAVFDVAATIPGKKAPVYRVTTNEYPYPSKTGYYIDSRFVKLTERRPPERKRRLPSREEVLDRLLKAQGSIYVWGGNIPSGIPQLRKLYPPARGVVLPPETAKRWELRGVDCSGLLYQATDGFTPRNTSALTRFGKPVPIAGLTTRQIIDRVQPLDIIVWNGHVLIILDRNRLIESHLDCATGMGVRVRPLRQALDSIRKERTPLDSWPDGDNKKTNGFVIRRWYE